MIGSRLLAAMMLAAPSAMAADFSGHWTIDLRNAEQRARNAECGSASFTLDQNGSRITGSHAMATVDCSRLDEGGEGTVAGTASGKRAVLTVTSGRNGAVVEGIAKLDGGRLHWLVTKEIKAGETQGDSPLILGKGVLTRCARSATC